MRFSQNCFFGIGGRDYAKTIRPIGFLLNIVIVHRYNLSVNLNVLEKNLFKYFFFSLEGAIFWVKIVPSTSEGRQFANFQLSWNFKGSPTNYKFKL